MFSIEEISLMKLYSSITPDRKEILRSLKDVVDEIDQSDTETTSLVKDTIRKLTALNDDTFGDVDYLKFSFYQIM